jgi:hypothetical protein
MKNKSFSKFAQLKKVDVEKRQVWGVAASETPDRDGEIMDYERSKPHFEAWSLAIQKASGGKSKGNLRVMHQPIAAGRIISMEMRDDKKEIYIGAEVVDENEWQKVLKGVYTGFSIGGKYGTWSEFDGAYKRYEAIPSETSLADLPCNPDATFEVVKANGVSELKKFTKDDNEMDNLDEQKTDEEPVNKDGQQEADEHNDVMSLLDDAIANGSDEIKALAEKLKAAIQSEEEKEVEKTDEAVAESESEQAATSKASAEGEADESGETATVDRDAIRAEVIALLEELGLVSRDNGAIKITMNAGMEKVNRANELQKTEIQRLSKDVITLTASLVELENRIKKAGGVGPVLRDLGAVNSASIAKLQEVEVLRKSLDTVTDPNERQNIQLRIAQLEIAAIQQQKKG